MSLASATARFNRVAFRARAQSWPVTVTAKGYTGNLTGAKSPTILKRVPQEQGAGWIQQAHSTFNFAGAGSYQPDIGAEFTITDSQTAAEVGTIWRCFSVLRANLATNSDHRCECFRLD
jgi:hypothetical protein